MPSSGSSPLQDGAQFLEECSVEPAVFELEPDYRALLMTVTGLTNLPDSSRVDALIERAEAHARELLASAPVEEIPHVAAWRDAYRNFGAKPQRTRNSLEALVRRAPDGLPRVNPLTDLYNAISVLHEVPIGGEDLDRYLGPARLARATGLEEFDTVAEGEPVVEHPEPGEVVWRDEHGVTCRRWNWRQGRRTALSEGSRNLLFIVDALAPMDDASLQAVGDELKSALAGSGTISISRRVFAKSATPE